MTISDQNSLTGPKVVALAYDRLSTFEFGVAVEVFGLTRPEFGTDWYRFSVASADGPRIAAIGGVQLFVSNGLEALQTADIIVLPGWRSPYADVPSELIAALQQAQARNVRIVAICGGAYILAATGLLKGRHATTHWRFIDHFVRAYPDIKLDDAPLFCEEDNLYTSAGSAAGIDLCLHVVRQDYGLDKANSVARRLVVSPLRAGQQQQTLIQPVLPQNKHHRLSQTLEILKADMAAGHTIDDAAKLAGLSPRTFIRQFEAITGTTFGKWMGLQRYDRAAGLLQETDLPIDLIADACGYASSSSLRRLFKEEKGVTPSAFRKSRKGHVAAASL
ncbi:helix-turn-helix domain-containing protein [Algimonas porphyrae]|uniref:Transcriptional regulator FtrA n=1 Tax=Algimonas porphyrae TaxID=1128113 RepID=A0ABQ5V4X7_9PROT|nr:helix-turn-helix domain-containing protein [Algimonas porphyrae]GLQ21908.1 transcriptional regulator FtrA [Algimonas porphyrae]